MHRRAPQGREEMGLEYLGSLVILSNLGTVLASQGKYEEAESMLRRALQGFQKFGLEHPQTLASAENL